MARRWQDPHIRDGKAMARRWQGDGKIRNIVTLQGWNDIIENNCFKYFIITYKYYINIFCHTKILTRLLILILPFLLPSGGGP